MHVCIYVCVCVCLSVCLSLVLSLSLSTSLSLFLSLSLYLSISKIKKTGINSQHPPLGLSSAPSLPPSLRSFKTTISYSLWLCWDELIMQ